MGQKERKALEVFFDDEARSVLYSLVDRDCPTQKTLNVADDIFEPTISSLFCLFNNLMIEHTPDLYQVEWISIACAIENTASVGCTPCTAK